MSTYAAIVLISAATLLLELSFLRIFAVQQFYHFAFMAISLALLGAGASGSWLSISRHHRSPAVLSIAFSLASICAYLIINHLPFDSFSIAWDSRQLPFLAVYFLSAAIPFFFAGLITGGELTRAGQGRGGKSQFVYGANLLGAGLGSLGSLLVLSRFSSEGAVLVTAVLGAFSAILFQVGRNNPTNATEQRLFGLLLLILLSSALWLLFNPGSYWSLHISPYKALSILTQLSDAKHTFSRSNSTIRVDIVESQTIHSMPGLSLFAPVGLPGQAGLMLDGDNLMPITNLSPDTMEASLLAGYMPVYLAYLLHPHADTLVIEAGTGLDALIALAAGARTVTITEENPLIIKALSGEYADFTYQLYSNPRLSIVNQNSRTYAAQAESAGFDVAVISLTDPHRPVTSGAYSLTEDYTYTVEAFAAYLNLVNENGLLVATRWLQIPPSESGRLFALVHEALKQHGVDPRTNIIAYRSLRTMTILAKLQPFEPHEIEQTREFLKNRGYDAVYIPGITPSELNRYNQLQEPIYYQLFQSILLNAEQTYKSYRFDVRPPSDDHPFFYHYFKWNQTPEILATLGQTWQPFGGSGFFVLFILLILVVLAASIFIMLPLLIWRGREPAKTAASTRFRVQVLIYYGCIGLAYLFVEIPIAQRFILVLDDPLTALAVVLFALLLASGIGSLTVQRWPLAPAMLVLVFMIILYPTLIKSLTPLILPWPGWARIMATIGSLAPLGYLMGMPFAGQLSVVEKNDSNLVPWVWAINGSFSVISSVLAVLVALTWNFAVVLWLGAVAYASALLVIRAPSGDHLPG